MKHYFTLCVDTSQSPPIIEIQKSDDADKTEVAEQEVASVALKRNMREEKESTKEREERYTLDKSISFCININKESNIYNANEVPTRGPNKGKQKFLSRVYLTPEEYNSLVQKFGEKATHAKIEEMDLALGYKGYKYKSHYLAILAWDRRKSTIHRTPHMESFAERDKRIKDEIRRASLIMALEDCGCETGGTGSDNRQTVIVGRKSGLDTQIKLLP